MIEIRIQADSPAELREYCGMLGGLAGGCVEATPTVGYVSADTFRDTLDREHRRRQSLLTLSSEGTAAPCDEEPAKPKTRRSRKKKTDAAKEDAPPAAKVEEDAPSAKEEPATKAEESTRVSEPSGEPLPSVTDVRAELVRIRDKVGFDKIRDMLADMGGLLADIDEDKYPEVLRRARELAA